MSTTQKMGRFEHRNLAAAPEGTYEYNWVGKNAGVEMVAGFVGILIRRGW